MEDNKWFGMDGFNRDVALCSYNTPQIDLNNLKSGVVTINDAGVSISNNFTTDCGTIVISAGSVRFKDGTNLEDFKEAMCGSGNGGYKESSIGHYRRSDFKTLNFRRA